jgi:hypothetical protein
MKMTRMFLIGFAGALGTLTGYFVGLWPGSGLCGCFGPGLLGLAFARRLAGA